MIRRRIRMRRSFAVTNSASNKGAHARKSAVLSPAS